jgi:uncharacterized SAM-binding protein YcdF (DUF218 family)
MRTRKIWAIVKAFIAFLALFLIAINLVPALFVRVPMNPVGNKKYDVIIVLGYPALEDGRPSPMLKQRVVASIDLYQHHYGQHLIFTGGAAHNRFVEAEVMSEVARSMGVLATSIVRETKAKNTCQNALYSVGIMRQRNWHSAIVVTSPNHLKRASYLFARYPIDFAVSSAGYPSEMNVVERMLFEQWEQYALTRLAALGYPNCKSAEQKQ